MQLPGFTAEESLIEKRGAHRLNKRFTDQSGGITPQRIKVKTVYCDCDSDGYCECDDGTALNDWTGMLDILY